MTQFEYWSCMCLTVWFIHTCIGMVLSAWRQHGENVLLANAAWAAMPFWVWFVPISYELRMLVISFWNGFDWRPPAPKDEWNFYRRQ